MSLFFHLKHWLIPHESNNQKARLLHPTSLIVIIVLIIISQVGLRQTSNLFPQILGYASQIAPEEIIRLTNLERNKVGLANLQLNSKLSQAASRKAADMFARNYWAHVSPVGTLPWTFITESGYAYRYAGENLARDFSTPGDVVSAWMHSPTHKDNLLSNRYKDIGVAVVDGSLDGRDTTLVVQMFGTPLGAETTPSINRTAGITVLAAEPETTPIPTAVVQIYPQASKVSSKISPFDVNKALIYSLLGVLAIVLFMDILIVYKKSLVRWSSKSLAHLIFIITLLIAVAGILRGQIL